MGILQVSNIKHLEALGSQVVKSRCKDGMEAKQGTSEAMTQDLLMRTTY